MMIEEADGRTEERNGGKKRRKETEERNEGCFVLITALPVIQSDFTRKGSVDDDGKKVLGQIFLSKTR